MKHRAIEVMVRAQFNIPVDVKVAVEFQYYAPDTGYRFYVEWWEEETHCFTEFDMHQIECVRNNLGEDV